MNRSWKAPCFSLLVLWLFCDDLTAAAPAPQAVLPDSQADETSGIVVESVEEGAAAHIAGLLPGDVLERWRREASPPANPEPADGVLGSPFDLEELELEQAPRGPLTLTGTRDGERLQVRLTSALWKLHARPQFAASDLTTYEQARVLVGQGEVDKGLALWGEMASRFEEHRHPRAAWLLHKIAKTASAHRSWQVAEQNYSAALDQAGTLGETSVLALIADSQAATFRARGELEQAQKSFLAALEARQADASKPLSLAASLRNLGMVNFFRGDLISAKDLVQRALALQEELAPHSLALAKSLHVRGNVAGLSGDLAAADGFLRRAVSLWETLAPQGVDLAKSLHNLGNVAFYRGDLVPAEEFLRRALVIRDKLAPHSSGVAIGLNSLGAVAWYRGDLESAEDYYRRALAIQEKSAPESLDVAASLNNLGIVATDRGNLDAAEELILKALAIREQRAPESMEVAKSLNGLGEIAFAAEDFTAAESYLRRSLAIEEQLAPRSVDTAGTLHRLAEVSQARSLFDTAEALFERSLAIRQERAPASALVATGCWRQATLYRLRNQLDRAQDSYNCAIDALEAQKGKLGGSDEARSGFGAKYASIYREAVDLLVETGQTKQAFHLLERFRARELLALLAQRDLVFSSDIPEDLERRRRSANRAYEQVFNQWMRLPEQASEEQRQATRQRLDRTRRQQDEIRSEIRTASPRLAALQDPQPADLDTTTQALDPGTLLLSYSIGKDNSHLFAVGPNPGQFQTFPLEVGEATLRDDVERFREALGRGRVDRRPEKVILQARQLSQQLLAPAAALIEQAERLLILTDGPLHSQPFAALADPTATAGHRFLVEAKPVHHAASATVFALLKQERQPRRKTQLTAFGDPLYLATASPQGDEGSPRLRAAVNGGLQLTPLPATRDEVESLRQIYPESSRIFLGAEATEGELKAVDVETTHLHIASHGLLDDQFPLDSALAFSIPPTWREGEDNGLLQAWEIFEQVRLDADLVTLSACDTGLGKVQGGEGLLGLTRAFQYAGARSILASLWSVGDVSTGELMKRFYGHLEQGQSKDKALRSAQLELLRGSEHSHPFHWAGFELVGDWR